jgi:hypothetical protein
VDERRLRIGSLFEWVAAALGVAGLVWVLSVPVQHLIGPRVDAALVDVRETLPPGVPSGVTSVPVMLLLDGRSVRIGDLESKARSTLGQSRLQGPPIVTTSEFGGRSTYAYVIDGSRLYVVCERTESGGPMRVAGIFVH